MGDAKRRRGSRKITWTAGSHHTLIIEWLADDERKTGTELAERLRSWGSAVELCCCHSAKDVLVALYGALDRLRITGEVPVIHLEAHGLESPVAGDDSGLRGPDGVGGEEDLLWVSLTPLLGQLNIASYFQLLLVGAACFGLTALDGFNIRQAAPFSALVGFSSRVNPSRLLDSMIELYRQLLRGGHGSIPDAVEAANRELYASEGEALVTTSFYLFAQSLLQSYLRRELEPSFRKAENQRLTRVKAQCGQVVSLEEMTRVHRATAIRHCREAVKIWFAYRDLPENCSRFRIDVLRLFDSTERSFRVANRVMPSA
ncbi:hypothetical protein EJMOOK_02265 [Rhodanobacter sp. Root179]